MVKGDTVCRGYYAKLHEVSPGKIMKANQLAKNGDVAVSGRGQSLVPRDSKQTVHAVAFWSIWFDEFCQKPNNEVRLAVPCKPDLLADLCPVLPAVVGAPRPPEE